MGDATGGGGRMDGRRTAAALRPVGGALDVFFFFLEVKEEHRMSGSGGEKRPRCSCCGPVVRVWGDYCRMDLGLSTMKILHSYYPCFLYYSGFLKLKFLFAPTLL